jgi:hypothetical protein
MSRGVLLWLVCLRAVPRRCVPCGLVPLAVHVQHISLTYAAAGEALNFYNRTITILDDSSDVPKIEKVFPNEQVFDKWFMQSGYSDLVEEGTCKAYHMFATLKDGGTYRALTRKIQVIDSTGSSWHVRQRSRGHDDDDSNDGGSEGSGGGASSQDGAPSGKEIMDAFVADKNEKFTKATASDAKEWDKLARRGAAVLARLWAGVCSLVAALARWWSQAVGAVVNAVAPLEWAVPACSVRALRSNGANGASGAHGTNGTGFAARQAAAGAMRQRGGAMRAGHRQELLARQAGTARFTSSRRMCVRCQGGRRALRL